MCVCVCAQPTENLIWMPSGTASITFAHVKQNGGSVYLKYVSQTHTEPIVKIRVAVDYTKEHILFSEHSKKQTVSSSTPKCSSPGR